MRSTPVNTGDAGTATWADNLRDDAYAASMLLAHQQATPDMTLHIESGVYYVGITRVLFAGGTTPSFTAPTSHPRIDIVTADSSGTIAITQGVENASPSAPAYPTNKVVICEVYNVVGETTIYDNANQVSGQGYISNDVRMILQPVYIGSATQVATGLFIPWISSAVQGDFAWFNGTAWVRLPAGIAGQFLQTQGASASPQWATSGQRYLLGGSATGTDYQTTSGTFVDVDGTNLTKAISGLVLNQSITVAYSFQMKGITSGGHQQWQIVDKTNGAVLASGGPSGTSFITYQGLIQYSVAGISATIALQFSTNNSGDAADINNANTSGADTTPSILIYT